MSSVHWICSLTGALLAVASAGAAEPTSTLQTDRETALSELINQKFNLRSSKVVQVAVDGAPGSSLTVSILSSRS